MFPHRSTNYNLFGEKLTELTSFQEISCAAVESGFIIRSRKIFPVEFLLTLIFGFYSKEEPSISKFLRIYNSLVDKEKKVVYSSFYERFNNEALAFVDKCLENYISRQKGGVNAELKGYLRTFKDVLIKDNTIVRVHSYLANKYPATRTRRITAGIKVSVLLSVVCNGPHSVTFFPEKTNDAKTLIIDPWVKDILLLIDRGFFKFEVFAQIVDYGGSFVTRLKSSTTSDIVSVGLGIPEKMRKKIIGLDIQKAIEVIKPHKLDIDAIVTVRYYPSGKKKGEFPFKLRFIAIFNEDTDEYHTYFTNIPEHELAGRDVAALYAARWDIENLFREAKSENLLGRLKSKNEAITEIFIRIPIIRLIISRELFGVARRMLEASVVMRLKKRSWAIVFAENARQILYNLGRQKRGLRVSAPWRDIWETLVEGAISPHVNRKTHTSKLYI
ncbi:IS4 family transposase [Methanospirillum purgamenti]|uniref:IS4 family transposase n=1 Tax=Methanospirillum purgamenti TaxID=2834276 RepID=UPI002A242B2A|nr:IS4 family transposase [Methanospirillum hungatei]MDX8550687.1 IS4 family transposase [Methanospirillum hungatei]